MLAAGTLESVMSTHRQRLFFALRPPPGVLGAIELAAQRLEAAALVRGNWLKPEKYHITLQFLGTFECVPDDLIERARRAGAAARFAPIDIELDRLSTFGDGHRSPCVLRVSPHSEPALQAFWRELGTALAAQHVDAEARPYLPHLTLAYGEMKSMHALPIGPIQWRATQFTLMRSHVGQARHEQLADWPP